MTNYPYPATTRQAIRFRIALDCHTARIGAPCAAVLSLTEILYPVERQTRSQAPLRYAYPHVSPESPIIDPAFAEADV